MYQFVVSPDIFIYLGYFLVGLCALLFAYKWIMRLFK